MMQDQKLKLAAIVGPTAAGKTNIAIKTALKLPGEIVSCDSMQVYKYMDIGTAKASAFEQNQVPHHLIDLIEPDIDFSVAEYQRLSRQAIEKINQSHKIPILVGGTGLYYQAVVDDYQFYPLAAKEKVRAHWREQVALHGLATIYQELAVLDPVYAEKISPNDEKRVIRALEVYDLTGFPFSQQQQKREGVYKLCLVGLYLERNILYQRINRRVDEMIKQGLIEEVERLRAQGYDLTHNAMQALGYKQVLYYLDGFINREQMVEEIKIETRRYAKRQLTWFNRDRRIRWIDLSSYPDEEQTAQEISTYMEGLFS